MRFKAIHRTLKFCGFAIGLLFLSLPIQSQNLVPNWSFEDTVHCPGGTMCPITNAKFWHSPNPDSPDYYNSCSYPCNVPGNILSGHYQVAKNGNAYAGVFLWNKTYPNDREYVQVKLTDSLVKDKWYCAGFWVSLVDYCWYSVNKVGLFVSKNPVNSTVISNLPYTPQVQNNSINFLSDSLNWVLISGSFQAQGGEEYITIGNFENDTNTDTLLVNSSNISQQIYSKYLIDAVFLYDCSESVQAYAGEDAGICGDETAQLGTSPIDRCHYKWTPSAGLDNDTLANPIAKPTQNTTYCLTMTDQYYQITTDTVLVKVTDDCKQVFFIPNIFSPNSDGQNDVFRIRGENISKASLQIYNRWGNLVFESQDVTQGWDGTFNGKDCEEDVYYFKAEIIFKDGRVENRKGSLTLVR